MAHQQRPYVDAVECRTWFCELIGKFACDISEIPDE
jgi:hypothetical protein